MVLALAKVLEPLEFRKESQQEAGFIESLYPRAPARRRQNSVQFHLDPLRRDVQYPGAL